MMQINNQGSIAMFARTLVWTALASCAVSAADAAVFRYEFQRYYDPNCGAVSSGPVATAPVSGLMVEDPVDNVSLPLKFKEYGSSMSLDRIWAQGPSTAKFQYPPTSFIIETDLLQSAPNITCGTSTTTLNPTAVVTTSTDPQEMSGAVEAMANTSTTITSNDTASIQLGLNHQTGTLVLVNSTGVSGLTPTAYLPSGFSGLSMTAGSLFYILESSEVPEPSSLVCLGLGLAAVAGVLRLQRRASAV